MIHHRRRAAKNQRRQQLQAEGRYAGGTTSQEFLHNQGLVSDSLPRNSPAYKIIQSAFPHFEWEKVEVTRKSGPVQTVRLKGYPTITREDGKIEFPSLADLVIDAQRPPHERPLITINAFPPKIQAWIYPLLKVPYGKEFAQQLLDVPVAVAEQRHMIPIMHAVANWLHAVVDGIPSTIVTPVCPDWETMETGDPHRPIVYTFKGLGSGIGLVAQRALRVLPMLWDFFKKIPNADVTFVIPIGDNEADATDTLKRIGVTKEQFIARNRESQAAFKKACPPDMPLQTPLMTEIDRDVWYFRLEEHRRRIEAGDFGLLDPTEKDIEAMCDMRRSLFERWHGEGVDILPILKAQGAEYATFGTMAQMFSKNTLILGCDDVAMAPFFQVGVDAIRPVLYASNRRY